MSFTRECEILDSDNISRIRYAPEDKIMEVIFQNGQLYKYSPVQPMAFASIVAAKSVGSEFNRLIRNNEAIAFERIGEK
jgi:hypothetical protein